jgi:hypothetical protein
MAFFVTLLVAIAASEVRPYAALGLGLIAWLVHRDIKALRADGTEVGPTVAMVATPNGEVTRYRHFWRLAAPLVITQIAGALAFVRVMPSGQVLLDMWLGAAVLSFPGALLGWLWQGARTTSAKSVWLNTVYLTLACAALFSTAGAAATFFLLSQN